MGLFDFVKTMGKKLFEGDAEAAEKIKAHIAHDNPGVEGLQVSYENGVVSLTGKARSDTAAVSSLLPIGWVADRVTSPKTKEITLWIWLN